jgi:hypothetical protein
MPAETLAEHELQELDRRIVNDHGYMGHWRAKASVLLKLGRTPEAKAAIAGAKASNDNHFWPRLAEASLALQNPFASTSAPAAAAAPASAPASTWPQPAANFEAWARANPTFTHYYYLSLLDRTAGRDAEALAAIEEALKQPVAASADDTAPTALYLWDMARFALAQGKYDLVLKITDAWQKNASYPQREEDSYLALAAAAKLAKGDPAAAEAELKKLAARKTVTWAKNIDALRAAVERGDTKFRYDPGPNPPPYQVFQLPE